MRPSPSEADPPIPISASFSVGAGQAFVRFSRDITAGPFPATDYILRTTTNDYAITTAFRAGTPNFLEILTGAPTPLPGTAFISYSGVGGGLDDLVNGKPVLPFTIPLNVGP